MNIILLSTLSIWPFGVRVPKCPTPPGDPNSLVSCYYAMTVPIISSSSPGQEKQNPLQNSRAFGLNNPNVEYVIRMVEGRHAKKLQPGIDYIITQNKMRDTYILLLSSTIKFEWGEEFRIKTIDIKKFK